MVFQGNPGEVASTIYTYGGAVDLSGAEIRGNGATDVGTGTIRNTGSVANGACLWGDGNTTLVSDHGNWGADDGAVDVAVEDGDSYSFGPDASFVCDADGCR